MLELLTRPWTLHILWALSHDARRAPDDDPPPGRDLLAF